MTVKRSTQPGAALKRAGTGPFAARIRDSVAPRARSPENHSAGPSTYEPKRA